MLTLKQLKAIIATCLVVPLVASVLNGLRNPRGIPDGSLWNYAELVLVCVCAVAILMAPFLASMPWRVGVKWAAAALALFVVVQFLSVAISFLVFGLPVQG